MTDPLERKHGESMRSPFVGTSPGALALVMKDASGDIEAFAEAQTILSGIGGKKVSSRV